MILKLQDAVHLVPSLSVLLGLSWFVPRTFEQLLAPLAGSNGSKVASLSDRLCDVSHHEPNGFGHLNVGHLKEDLQVPRERKHGNTSWWLTQRGGEVFWFWHMKSLEKELWTFLYPALDRPCKENNVTSWETKEKKSFSQDKQCTGPGI